MATVIPSSLPSRATQGERRLHALLARLPGDCIVYYEPLIDGRHPDFVVIIPQLGVLVIEVKGWYAATLQSCDANSVTLIRDSECLSARSPLKQAREYLFRLMDEAFRHRWSKCLVHPEGDYKGRFRFPFAAIVVLSNITQSALTKRGVDLDDWSRVFPSNQTLTRDSFAILERKSETELLDALRPYVHPSWPFAPLNADEVKTLRAIVHPEILLGDQPKLASSEDASSPFDDQQKVVEVLDLRQENHAQAMGQGHRIVYGVAGSGKTLLLLARAKRLAESGNRRVLVTCYNRTLAAWMRDKLKAHANVSVYNFHQWAHRCGTKWRANESDKEFGERFLRDLQSTNDNIKKWDAILIDEAQDFEPMWFRCLLQEMRDPENGDLLIVADGCQSLYGRSKIRWSDLGIKARGRTMSSKYDLDVNYRNTREIIAAAESFAEASADRDDADAIQEVRVDTKRCQRSNAIKPILFRCPNRKAELEHVTRLVKDLVQGQWQGGRVGVHAPRDIAVLYPAASAAEKLQLESLRDRLCDQGIPAIWLSKDTAAREHVDGPGVKIQTIHSAKGLQYRAVIVMWTDKLPDRRQGPEGDLTDRRRLYVGMTRAVNLLALTACGRSRFVDELASMPTVDVVDVPRDNERANHFAEPSKSVPKVEEM